MTYKHMLEKTIDLLINLAVVSLGVSIFEGKFYGVVVACIAYLAAMSLCVTLWRLR